MAENSKLELGEKMRTQKVSSSDHTNGTEDSDSFVIDIKTFCHGSGKDVSPNSRIIRNLSRKGSPRCEKIGSTSTPRGITLQPTILGAVPSACTMGSDSSSEAAATEASSQVDEKSVNASNMGTEGRAFLKRNSLRRSSTWGLDPKRILILFASLSSIGTMLLIYFTLSISSNAEENGLELDGQR